MRIPLAVLALLACAPAPVAAAPATIEGPWRGNWTVTRPDGREARVFLRLGIQRADSGFSGTIGHAPFGPDVPLERVESRDGRVRLAWHRDGAAFTFDGELRGHAIAGVTHGPHGEAALAVERIEAIDEQGVWELAGVYRRDDGHRILLSPQRFALNVYDLDSGEFAGFFPRDARTFFGGGGNRVLAPATDLLTVDRTPRGTRLSWTRGGRRWRLEPSTEVRLEHLQLPGDGVSLGATIFWPTGAKAPLPAMLSAVGSGRQTRYGAAGLNAYRAAWLALRGVAVIVHDKRGSGSSTGRYESLGMDTMATDLVTCLDHLAGRPEVDRSRIGILVHSQSGIFAPEIIRRSRHVAFGVVLSSTVVNGELQEIVRTEQQLRADGFPQAEVDDAVATQVLKFYYANHRVGWDAYVAAYRRVKDRVWFEDIVGSTIDPKRHSWDFWRSGNRYEPAERWKEVGVPMLFLFGDKDAISPVASSIALLDSAFAGERRALLAVQTIPNATHDLFAGTEGGLYDEIGANRTSDFMARAWEWMRTRGWRGGRRP